MRRNRTENSVRTRVLATTHKEDSRKVCRVQLLCTKVSRDHGQPGEVTGKSWKAERNRPHMRSAMACYTRNPALKTGRWFEPQMPHRHLPLAEHKGLDHHLGWPHSTCPKRRDRPHANESTHTPSLHVHAAKLPLAGITLQLGILAVLVACGVAGKGGARACALIVRHEAVLPAHSRTHVPQPLAQHGAACTLTCALGHAPQRARPHGLWRLSRCQLPHRCCSHRMQRDSTAQGATQRHCKCGSARAAHTHRH